MSGENPTNLPPFGINEISSDVPATYAHLWQFETWLRRIVYVQLRALDGDDWQSKIKAGKASLPKSNDKRMTHMPTPEDDVLSFIQLSELQRVVAEHWHLFEAYLPPRTIWEAKLEEVVAIRHRIAHFRSLHRDDLARVRQFLRDIDQGFWRACTAYNSPRPVLPQSGDAVVAHFLPLDLFAWTEVGEGKWARVGHADPSERFSTTVEILTMPWATWQLPIAGRAGFLYDVSIHVRGARHFDYSRLLRSTEVLHGHVVHVCLQSGATTFRFTLPAVLGNGKLISIIEGFHEGAQNALLAGPDDKPIAAIEAMARQQPEYVLGPENPLGFLSLDMPCEFFRGLDG